jgi:hypothetical protein
MLSVAIKNAIIVILLIFIFHFLLKSHLYEKQTYSNLQPLIKSKVVEEPPKVAEPVPCLSVPAVPVKQSHETFEAPEKKSDDSDLFRFVFEDSAKKPEPREGTRIAAKCPAFSPTSGDTTGIAACNTHVVKAPEADESAAKCDAKAFSIINEYENESIMNGGQIFQGICGFDGSEPTPSSIDAFFSPTLI